MIPAFHAVAITLYLAAAVAAALPFARPVKAPLRSVLALLTAGVVLHGAALLGLARTEGAVSLSGLGPALSFAGFTVALIGLVAELFAREVTLTLVAAPLAGIAAAAANIAGLDPAVQAPGARGVWMGLHIVLAFVGLAAYAAAAGSGAMYLVARNDLKSRRFGAVFRFFPPLATLDRVNHVSAVAGFLGLTLAVALAAVYSIAYRSFFASKVMWGMIAWAGITALAIGRLRGALTARRAAALSTISFVIVIVLYVLVRLETESGGRFL